MNEPTPLLNCQLNLEQSLKVITLSHDLALIHDISRQLLLRLPPKPHVLEASARADAEYLEFETFASFGERIPHHEPINF